MYRLITINLFSVGGREEGGVRQWGVSSILFLFRDLRDIEKDRIEDLSFRSGCPRFRLIVCRVGLSDPRISIEN